MLIYSILILYLLPRQYETLLHTLPHAHHAHLVVRISNMREGQGHAIYPSVGSPTLIPCYIVLGKTQPQKLECPQAYILHITFVPR